MSCITTYSKEAFDPAEPELSRLNIIDIAHALSMLCRANGHFPHFYSVAQHCLNCAVEAVARGCSENVQLACLLHDASEAYMQDIPRPIKAELPRYAEIEDRLLSLIWSKWLPQPLSEDELREVFQIDDALLYYEFYALMGQEIIPPQGLVSEPKLDFEPFGDVEFRYIEMFDSLSGIKSPKFVGIDACRGGWVAVIIQNGRLGIDFFDSILKLCEKHRDADSLIIDIPIGLPDDIEDSRLRPDNEARQYLKNKDRKCSVFPTPFRAAVYADDYYSANEISRKLGRGLPSQAWAICSSIRQVDEFLCMQPQFKNRLVESHPELAFQALNDGKALDFSKHCSAGITERVDILGKYLPGIKEALSTQRSVIQNDILDAASLAVTGMLGAENGLATLPEHPKADRNGLLMQMVIPQISAEFK